jgi:hypothetical protein
MDKKQLLKIIKNLTNSYECHLAKEKDINNWDEYDYMMIPYWREALMALQICEREEKL